MQKAKILVVDDEAVVARHVTSILKGLGYELPATAKSGAEAIEYKEYTVNQNGCSDR